jgi:hypothetical protein
VPQCARVRAHHARRKAHGALATCAAACPPAAEAFGIHSLASRSSTQAACRRRSETGTLQHRQTACSCSPPPVLRVASVMSSPMAATMHCGVGDTRSARTSSLQGQAKQGRRGSMGGGGHGAISAGALWAAVSKAAGCQLVCLRNPSQARLRGVSWCVCATQAKQTTHLLPKQRNWRSVP